LLVARPHDGDRLEILLQLRAAWTHQGGNWALPGGARDSHEDVVAAALREAREEAGLDRSTLRVMGQLPGVDHVDWSYTYVVALAVAGAEAVAATAESDELRWVPPQDVAHLPLHPAFGAAWPRLWPVVREVFAR
jgi:8-oxo-dGTP diphosphatase